MPVASGAMVVLRPHRRGPAVRARSAARRSPAPTCDAADPERRTPRRRASRSLARRQRRGRGPRVLLPRGADGQRRPPAARVCRRHRGRRALRPAVKDLAPARCSTRRSTGIGYGVRLLAATAAPLLHAGGRRLAPAPGLAARGRHAPADGRRWSTRRTTSGSGWASGPRRDDRWLMIGAGFEDDLRGADPRRRRTPTGEFRVVAPRREGVEYDVEPAGDRLLIVHNAGLPSTPTWPGRRSTPRRPSSGSR